ncbi:MAG TPA: hypothetical protein VF746_24545 [Longimicrobium sp.]|jgi:hypothetical protein
MPKLRLELEALAVESFDTAPAAGGAGTVRGHAEAVPADEIDCSRCPTCDASCRTCELQDTCWQTCAASCQGSCDSCTLCQEITCATNCLRTCQVDCTSPGAGCAAEDVAYGY